MLRTPIPTAPPGLAPSEIDTTRSVRAWDLPTRLFKWMLVALVVLAWVTQRYGEAWGDISLKWHRYNGYAILILLVFRVLWGFVGSSTARFSAWVSSPFKALDYGLALIKREPRPYLGHNPLGAWMIIALLLGLASQGIAGLFTVDQNDMFGGPFAAFEEPTAWHKRLASYHHQAYYFILALVTVHVCVNLFYQYVKKDPIIRAMITGRKPVEPFKDQPEMTPAPAEWARALACLAAAAVIVLGGIKLFGGKLG